MKILLALLVVVGVAAVVELLVLDDSGEDEDSETGTEAVVTETGPDEPGQLTGSACERLASLADRLAGQVQNPDAFLKALGREAAGIREGRRATVDLARGGSNRIPGKGFREQFDDGTTGQVRHFAGVAVATVFGGANPTRWISENLRGDRANSADGLLTEEAIEFSGLLREGELALEETPDWILTNLCLGG